MTDLTNFLGEVRARWTGERVNVCYPDSRRAFNPTNHRLLEQEMKAFGVDVEVKSQITRNVKCRSVRKRVHGCLSHKGPIFGRGFRGLFSGDISQ